MKLAKEHISRLLNEKENERVEFKRASSELPENLWETYSAFCNTDGGTIILGIREEKHFRTITFSNPGTMRVSKSVAVAGGTSDARNSAIFNIFALVDIGERSGMGLANLHGLWKKYGYAEPKITESYDPDRTVLVVTTDDDTVTRPEPDQKSRKSVLKSNNEVDNKVDNNARGDNKVDNKVDNKIQEAKVQSERKSLNELPASCRQVFKALSEDGSLTQQALVRKLSLSRAAITKAIAILIKECYIVRCGARKNGYWEVLP